ncbi:hypothetical protein QFZ41_001793 [Luteibacter sp. W1I16]|uniref:DUF802 domain-containing protein n=1 Tax=Luteibacter sp. W1I16 TaxID=3373922 RepID=UPI003D1CAF60
MFRNLLYFAVFLVGLAAIGWVGIGYIGSNPLGAAVAGLIGACYLVGALELHRYRQATQSLRFAVDGLSAPPSSLAAWLEPLHASLRNPVRLRIEGARAAMPAPALTPYLVGLLVLLGMLGTLLGMMATLRGTGIALESATDLQAIRGSLAAPVKGLGFAFGTSIAGVASSAMLGLLSALCRRERLETAQLLDVKIATTLRVHSQAHQREEAFRLLQQQAESMPALVDRLQAMMAALERNGLEAGERQLANQEAFHASTHAMYSRLASSVEASLKDSVAESARAASAALQPVIDATMAGLAREAASLHDTVTDAVQRHLNGLTAGFQASTAATNGLWNEALAEQRRTNEALSKDLRGSLQEFTQTFEERSTGVVETVSARFEAMSIDTAAVFERHASSLVDAVRQSQTNLQNALASRDEERLTLWADTLARTAGEMTAQIKTDAAATIAEISRLVEAASEAPKVAADVVAELRQKLSDSMVRDTAMLEERSRLLATLETLLDAVNHASTEQRSAVDALVATSADLLERVGSRFTGQIESGTGTLAAVAAQVTGSAVEVASLGEAFASGVQLFGQSNEALMERLEQVATALDNSLVRSDEQLAYYVAQAREVVDLSVLSQKQILDDMQRLAAQRMPAMDETA